MVGPAATRSGADAADARPKAATPIERDADHQCDHESPRPQRSKEGASKRRQRHGEGTPERGRMGLRSCYQRCERVTSMRSDLRFLRVMLSAFRGATSPEGSSPRCRTARRTCRWRTDDVRARQPDPVELAAEVGDRLCPWPRVEGVTSCCATSTSTCMSSRISPGAACSSCRNRSSPASSCARAVLGSDGSYRRRHRVGSRRCERSNRTPPCCRLPPGTRRRRSRPRVAPPPPPTTRRDVRRGRSRRRSRSRSSTGHCHTWSVMVDCMVETGLRLQVAPFGCAALRALGALIDDRKHGDALQPVPW